MSAPAARADAGTPPARPLLDSLFGELWPERSLPARPRLVVAAAAVGLLGAVILPDRLHGLGTFLVLVAVFGVVAAVDPRLRTSYHLVSLTLCTLLLLPLLLLDAVWVVLLCLLAAFAVGSAALADGRSVAGLLASAAAVPLAALRGLPWLGRSLTVARGRRRWAPALRTAALSVLAVVVFGALFASADPVFARWADTLVPDLSLGSLPLRTFTWLAVGGLTLAGGYVALNPPAVERLALPGGVPVARRFEWLVPVGVVLAVFLAFVAAQLTVMFGGHDYVRRTTGLGYADYVHQGFAQLTVVTVLTLVVVAVAARKAPTGTAVDRLLLRAVLGALCLLALVVVASALYRMDVYEDAYGFTRLRLLVSLFEGWLGVVLVLVLVAGVRLSGRWVPRAALLAGATALLALAALNPDAYIAEQNLARFERTARLDVSYLSGLSADAVPALGDLPPRLLGCLEPPTVGDAQGLEWNLARARARDALPPRPGVGVDCAGLD